MSQHTYFYRVIKQPSFVAVRLVKPVLELIYIVIFALFIVHSWFSVNIIGPKGMEQVNIELSLSFQLLYFLSLGFLTSFLDRISSIKSESSQDILNAFQRI